MTHALTHTPSRIIRKRFRAKTRDTLDGGCLASVALAGIFILASSARFSIHPSATFLVLRVALFGPGSPLAPPSAILAPAAKHQNQQAPVFPISSIGTSPSLTSFSLDFASKLVCCGEIQGKGGKGRRCANGTYGKDRGLLV